MMNPFLKPSAGPATSSEDKLFLKARLKLSALYSLFVFMLLAACSGLLYYELVINITDSFGDQLSAGSPQAYALHNTLEKLRTSIIVTDTIIILIVAVLSYLFAGWTLRPIRISLETRKRFAADASHELRTPLTAMKTELEVALRDASLKPKEMRNIFRSALEEVGHMTFLTEQLLFLSRMDALSPMTFTSVNLSRLADHAVVKMKKIAREEGLTLETSIMPEVHIQGHAHDLERVLYNLIQNAVTYTKKGSIHVRLEQSGTSVTLSVEDTGIGIPAKHVPHIFDRFYKADTARDSKEGGAGLGLAITKEIVQRHGGQMDIQSEPGKGTTFSIRFPAS
ncbi:MAG: hypothetical protein JWM56_1141 [Candidatus Peribacteria bacterium]|nr:hypothetical protein [Candidatus Peribacteria bacterium]